MPAIGMRVADLAIRRYFASPAHGSGAARRDLRHRMTSFRFARPFLCSLLLAGVFALVTVLAPAALGSAASAAAAETATHAGKSAAAKPCYDNGTFKGKKVRVPTNCAKPHAARKCYLTSTYDGLRAREEARNRGRGRRNTDHACRDRADRHHQSRGQRRRHQLGDF
jgi:hypothetical protein